MADHIAAEIHIGGKIPRSIVQGMCEAIHQSGAALQWSGPPCRIDTPDALLAARSLDADGSSVLKLRDDEARWGEFDPLEPFLREHGIAYRRWTDAQCECDAEVEAFHPQCGQVSWLTNHAGKPILLASQLITTETKLAELLDRVERGAAVVARDLAAVLETLRAELPPAVPPLEPLEIVED